MLGKFCIILRSAGTFDDGNKRWCKFKISELQWKALGFNMPEHVLKVFSCYKDISRIAKGVMG